ncbi:MAG: amino acid adenylation domain-containing protein [Nannocystaceae bacterium]
MTTTNSTDRHDLLARSLVQIKQLRRQLDQLREASHEPIAIVGVGLRLPTGIADPATLRERLQAGFDVITDIPVERWDLAELFDADPDAPGKMYTRHGGFLDEIDQFDAQFFGISPKEAAAMDPQQRVFLEVTHEALERAGLDVRSLQHSDTAVFAGATTWDYGARQAFGRPLADLDPYVMSGNIAAFLSGRVAYTYGLQGPCLTIDTACSSSLVAVHLAISALRRGETSLAIAGGVSVVLAPEWNVVLSRSRMMARDGHCKTFDAAADGYVRGEGCGVLVLKRWSQAQQDGDEVLALLRGSAINQDGPASGITVPNGLAQQEVVRSALADARVDAGSVGYVEAHGTGTSLGDPIEVRSLAAVYGADRGADRPLRLGSIKTNVGHLEPAAGVMGLIKAALSVRHGESYPHLHLRSVNPEIDLPAIPARVPTTLEPWDEPEGRPRRAGVSSFGASGTNVHVIVEQAPAPAPLAASPEPARPQLLVLSAKTEAALDELTARHQGVLSSLDAVCFADYCATAALGRTAYPHRAAVVATDPAAAAKRLGTTGAGVARGRASATPPRLAMVFAGQGSQARDMGMQLYPRLSAYREAFDQCDEILRPLLGCSLHDVITGAPGASSLDDTALTQPAIFAVEYALAQQWQAWGIEPSMVLGHSVGQLVAATVAGVFELPAALTLIAARGRMMQQLPGDGAMASLLADEARVRSLVESHAAHVSIAAINGPTSVAISGLRPAFDEVIAAATAQGIKVKPLVVSHAFHSPQMDPMLEPFAAEVERIPRRSPRIPLVSNLDGRVAGDEILTTEYWVRHLREPVRFAEGLATLVAAGPRILIEASPRPMVASMARESLPDGSVVLPSLRKGRDELSTMLGSLGELFVRGAARAREGVDGAEGAARRPTLLPTYPFQRRRHWIDVGPRSVASSPSSSSSTAAPLRHPLVDRRVPNPLVQAHFESVLGRRRHRFLADFVIDEVNVVNIGVYLEMVRGAVLEHHGESTALRVDALSMQRACLLQDDGPALELLLREGEDPSSPSFGIYTATEEGRWAEHCGGRLTLGADPGLGFELPPGPWDRDITGDELYAGMERLGIELGPAGRWITRARVDAARQRALISLRGAQGEEQLLTRAGGLHPGVIDALFQAAYAVLPAEVPEDSAYMLVGVDTMHLLAGGMPTQVVVSRSDWDAKARALTVDLVAADEAGAVVIAVERAVLKYASRELLRAQLQRGHERATGRVDTAAEGQQRLRGMPISERPSWLRERVLVHMAAVLGAAVDELDDAASLLELGLDSLMAVELKRVVEQDLAVSVPLGELLAGPSAQQLAAHVLEAMVFDGDASSADTATEAWTVSIDPDRAHEPFGLTDLQQAYLIGRGGAFELGNVSTYFFLEVDVDGIDMDRAQWAWNRVVERHGMLRAVFTDDGRQQILPEVPEYDIEVGDLRPLAPAQRVARLEATADVVRGRVFDTSQWPMFEIRASRIDDRRTRLHLGFDALVVDAWSTSMVFQQWAAIYRGDSLAPLGLSFRDYMVALERLRGSAQHARDVEYWERRIAELPAAPELPLACSPQSLTAPRFGHRTGRLTPSQWTALQANARAAKVTPSAALCTVYAEVIARWSRSRHFTLNLLFFNRLPLHAEVKDVVANFSSTTLLEIDARGSSGFRERAQRVQRQLADDLDHGLVTGVEVLRRLNRSRPGRGATMPVVFASTINLKARERDDEDFGLTSHLLEMGDGGEEIGSSIRTPQVWLDHQVLEEAGGLVFNWDVVEELFPAGMIDTMFEAYTALLHRLADEAGAWEGVLGRTALPAAELQPRRNRNETEVPIVPRMLHEGFIDHAERDPGKIAVITPSRELTYGELDRRSEMLARSLHDLDLGPDRLVAVMMPKGWEQVVAVLAIHKAGAAYLPVDPALPAARIEHLFDHAGARVALTVPPLQASVPSGARALAVRAEDPAPGFGPGERLRPHRSPEQLAYVIYTSGSTGLPKGVAVTHAAAWNTIVDINQRFEVGPRDRALAISSLSFDLSVYDVFGLLAAGAGLVIPEGTWAREPARWAELVRDQGVTVWSSVPALAQMLGEHVAADGGRLGSLRLVMLSGDWIPVGLPDALRRIQPGLAVMSLGGATEAAIWSIYYPIGEVSPQWPSIPYGRPLANQRFAVLDDDLEPRPQWVPGQLYICGDGLALGYWKDAERSHASFFTHPRTGERLYKTGDLGRYLADGDIEFLGREDGQVKVQGYRIELGEIDAALDRIPSLGGGVTTVHGERMGSRSLVAYVVPRGSGEVDLDEVRRQLGAQLPPYMVPTTFVPLPALPLTSNGKVDRKALPAPDAAPGRSGDTRVAPRDELERRLCALWSELLGVEAVGVFDDFFALGGQSFLAMRLMAWIREHFGQTLPLGSLVAGSTIAAQAELLREQAVDRPWTPVVQLHRGQGQPIVLVHPVGGNVLCYSALAHALAPRSTYGLVASGLQPGQAPADSIPSMAARYLTALDEAGIEGPLHLGGWSLGGVVAFEMARQAEASGRRVARVVLVDSRLEAPSRAGRRPVGELLAGLLSDLGRGAGHRVELGAWVRELTSEPELSAVLQRARSEQIIAPELELDVDGFERLWAVYRAGIEALDVYRPEPIEAPVLELVAADEAGRAARHLWSASCRGRHEQLCLPGDHYTLLQAPNRQALHEHLARAFE